MNWRKQARFSRARREVVLVAGRAREPHQLGQGDEAEGVQVLVGGRGLVGAARAEAVPAEQRALGEGDVVRVAEGEHPVGRARGGLPVLERDERHHGRVAVLGGRGEVDVLGRAVPVHRSAGSTHRRDEPHRARPPRRAPGSRPSPRCRPTRRPRPSRRGAPPGARRPRAACARRRRRSSGPRPPSGRRRASMKSVASASVRACRRAWSGCQPHVQPRCAVHCDQNVPPGVRLPATWSSTASAAAT